MNRFFYWLFTFACAVAFVAAVGHHREALAQQAVTATQGPSNPNFEWNQNFSARRGAKNQEVLVLTTAGGTAVPTTALVGRKSITLQNLGPNVIFCTLDGSSPLTTGALGYRIDANGGVVTFNVGPAVAVKCITTVNQLTTAATQVTELR